MTVMRRIILTLAVMIMPLMAMAQQQESKVALSPYVSYDITEVPEKAMKTLHSKLTAMVTANGFASIGNDLVITAVPTLLGLNVTATAPAQFVAEMEVEIFVLNNVEQVIIDQIIVPVRGIGQSEQKAMISAMGQLNARSRDVKEFMANIRSKVIEYYKGRIPAIITKANSLAEMAKFDEALTVLAAVPESLDEYPQIAGLMVDIYKKRIDREAQQLITVAKARIAEGDKYAAMDQLVKVDPFSSLSKDATKLINQMKANADAQLQKQIELKMMEMEQQQREYEDSIELERMQIEASREIALVQEDQASKFSSWFFGKLKKS